MEDHAHDCRQHARQRRLLAPTDTIYVEYSKPVRLEPDGDGPGPGDQLVGLVVMPDGDRSTILTVGVDQECAHVMQHRIDHAANAANPRRPQPGEPPK